MDDYALRPLPNESSAFALFLSALVHIQLVGALFYGVQWTSSAPASSAIEVWHGTQTKKQPYVPTPQPIPDPVPAPIPTPVPAEVKPPAPKPEKTAEPKPTIKPDIAIKQEEEKKKAAEEKRKADEKKQKDDAKKREDEKRKEETKKRDDEKRERDEKLKNDLAREQKELAREKAAAAEKARSDDMARQRGQMLAEQAGLESAGRGTNKYIGAIANKIRGNIILPPGIVGNPEAIFLVKQLPTGEILSVSLEKSSGNAALDKAIERAILKSSPLPKPEQASLFDRNLKVPYKPKEEY